MKPKVLLVLVLSFLFFGVSSVFAKVDLPNPIDYVSDFAEVLSPQFEVDLNQKLKDFEAQTKNQLFVVTIKSLGDMTIEEYGVELGQKWAVGQKGKDNGILVLFAPNDRKVRIEVGYGLEPIINDGRATGILDTEFIPEYRQNNYEQAISKTVTKIQFYLDDPNNLLSEPEPEKSSVPVLEIVLFFLLSGIPIYLLSYLSRSKEFYTGGIVGTILGALIGGIFAGIGLGLFGLLLDYLLSRNYKNLKSSGRSTNFWTSRGGFRSGGGFGGGGGFSGGGGGSFGGGGGSRSL